jgi:Protein of unknown function (DUF2971)
MPDFYNFPHDEFLLNIRLLCGYKERRQIFWKQLHSYPRFLCKYLGNDLSSEVGVDRLKDIVLHSRIWLSSRLNFNDPFDTNARYSVLNDEPALRKHFDRMIQEREPNLLWKKRKALVQKVSGSYGSLYQAMQQVSVAGHFRMINDMGIFCTSRNPKQMLMWSHYGAQHAGICLLFEPTKDLEVWPRSVAMKYSKDRPSIVYGHPSYSEQQEAALLTKFDEWRYEEEFRLLTHGGANKYLKFAAASLFGIVLGAKISEPSTSAILKLCRERQQMGHPDVQLFKARMHSSKFELLIDKYSKDAMISVANGDEY